MSFSSSLPLSGKSENLPKFINKNAGFTPELHLIWAQNQQRVIGTHGTLPWYIPPDLQHFSALTKHCPVIMGKRTWLSLPPKFRPLPTRLNLVLTTQVTEPQKIETNAFFCANLEQAYQIASQNYPQTKIWVIGGGSLYAQVINHATCLEVTTVDFPVAKGDTFAPQICSNRWQIANLNHSCPGTGISYGQWHEYTPKIITNSSSSDSHTKPCNFRFDRWVLKRNA